MKNVVWMLIFVVPVILFAQDEAEEKIWTTQLGVSYVNTSGNTETETFSGKLDVEGAGWGNRYILGSSYVFAQTADVESANKFDSEARAERILTGRLFAFLGATYLMDKYAGYDSRISIGPGLGVDLINNEKRTLKGMLSSMYYFDEYAIPDQESENYATGKAGLTYTCQIKEHVSWKALGDYLVSLDETDRYFITGDLSLQVGINSYLAVGLGYQINYQNAPPDPAIKKTDTTFLSSVVVNW